MAPKAEEPTTLINEELSRVSTPEVLSVPSKQSLGPDVTLDDAQLEDKKEEIDEHNEDQVDNTASSPKPTESIEEEFQKVDEGCVKVEDIETKTEPIVEETKPGDEALVMSEDEAAEKEAVESAACSNFEVPTFGLSTMMCCDMTSLFGPSKEEIENEKAVQIQTVARGKMARKTLETLKEEKAEREAREAAEAEAARKEAAEKLAAEKAIEAEAAAKAAKEEELAQAAAKLAATNAVKEEDADTKIQEQSPMTNTKKPKKGFFSKLFSGCKSAPTQVVSSDPPAETD